jgi:hypothetical protein
MLNVPPGAIVPELHAPVFDTEVCATESLFIHMTLPPTATVTGLGEYAVVVNVDEPGTIETAVPVVVGEVVDGDDDDPHAVESVNAQMMSAIRRIMASSASIARKVAARSARRDRCGPAGPIAHELAGDELRAVRCAFEDGKRGRHALRRL